MSVIVTITADSDPDTARVAVVVGGVVRAEATITPLRALSGELLGTIEALCREAGVPRAAVRAIESRLPLSETAITRRVLATTAAVTAAFPATTAAN